MPPGDQPPGGGFLDLPLGRFLDLVAGHEPAPGGGAVAAIAAAMAAGLVAMAARFSADQMVEASAIAQRCDGRRADLVDLADRDAVAYGAVLAALRLPREPDPQARRDRVGAAWLEATAAPTQVAEACAGIGADAAAVARDGNPNLRGDALTAAHLAAACARSAAHLAETNVRSGRLDPGLSQRADAAAAAAERAAAQIGGAGG